MIERYSPGFMENDPLMVIEGEGDFVLYTDYQKLQAENANLTVDLDAMILMFNILESENERLKESNVK